MWHIRFVELPGFVHLPSNPETAPIDFHLSLVYNSEMGNPERDAVARVTAAVHGLEHVVEIHRACETQTMVVSWDDAVFGPIWNDLVALRQKGGHPGGTITISA